MKNSFNNPVKDISGKSDQFNVQKQIMIFAGNWYYFVVCIVIALVVGYLYIAITPPTYRVTTTLLVEEESIDGLPEDNILQGTGLRPGARNLDNQIDILTARTLIRKVLGELPFEIDYYRKSLFDKVSFYPIDPITVIPDYNLFSNYNHEYSVKILGNDLIQIRTRVSDLIYSDTIVSFGQEVNLNGGVFKILPVPGIISFLDPNQRVFFTIFDRRTLVENFRNRIEISTNSREGSIVKIILQGTNKTKDIIFLDKLTEVYLISQLEKKNHEANRIIDFIDNQLVDVSDSLFLTENLLQDFRSKNMIMDISAQSQQIIDQAVILENEKARLDLAANYYKYLDQYLMEDNNNEVPISPVTMGIEDPLLGSLIQELSALQTEYYATELGERNPIQSQLEVKIRNNKQGLRESLQGLIRANGMAISDNATQIRRLNEKAKGLPIKERRLLGIERKFNLNNVMYTFLLQQRAEAQIKKASNKANNELVDPAIADLYSIWPKEIIVYLIALILGLGIPYIVILMGESFRHKVFSEQDIALITNLPLVGHIPHSRLSYSTVVLNEPQSSIAEAFRSLRTRMEFFTRDTHCPIIVVSSTMSGEGKTFASINLASAYSLAGKKTLLVGFDLRRPNFPENFTVNKGLGLSTYLIGKSEITDIIFQTEYENLDVIPAGPLPPNPAELSGSEKTIFLFEHLKNNYDFIIVDSAPIGSVSDSIPIASVANANILIVRHGKTIKRYLRATLQDVHDHGITGVSLLVNDLRSRKSSYRYAYGHKNKYQTNL